MPKAKGKSTKKAVAEAAKLVEVDEVVAVGSNGIQAEVGDASGKSYTVNDVEDEAQVKATTGRGGRGKRSDNKVVKEELSNKKAIAKGRGRVKKSEDIEVISEEAGKNGESNGVGSVSVEEKQQEVVAKSAVGKGRRGGKKAVAAKESTNENGEPNNDAELEPEKQDVAKTVRGRGGKKALQDKGEDLKEAESEVGEIKTEEPENNGPAKKVVGRKKKATVNEIEKETIGKLTSDTAKDEDESVTENEDNIYKTEQDAKIATVTAETKTAAKKQPLRKKKAEDDTASTELVSDKEVNGKSLFDILKEETEISKNRESNAKEATDEEQTIASVESDTKSVVKKSTGRKKKLDDKSATDTVIENVTNGETEKDIPQEDEPQKKKGRTAKKIAATIIKQVDAIPEEVEAIEIDQPQKRSGKRGTKADAEKPATKRGAKAQELENITEVEKKPTKRGRGATPKTAAANTIEEVTDIAANEEALPKKRSRNEISIDKELKPEVEKPKKAGRATGGKRNAEKLEDANGEQLAETEKDASKVNEAAAEATEDTLSTLKSEKVTNTNRGGRKRAAPSTNKSKAVADDDDDESKKASAAAAEATALEQNDDDEADGAKSSKSKKRKKEPSTSTKLAAAAPMNATSTLYSKEDFQLAPLAEGQTADEPRFNLKISSWNVAGLRAWLKKEGLQFLDYEEPDIFCLQETKCAVDQLPEEVTRIPGYHPYWLCMPGGYAGVAIYSKIMPINVEYGIGHKDFDDVGRVITAEYEKFFLINVYVPNSGRKLVNLEARMKWEKLFQEFVQKYNARKPVVICGDMNVSHQEIDLANPKTNTRNAGFTKEERDKMTELLSLGYVDTFRHLYPDRKGAYTFWTYIGNARTRNVGWRLDYFIVSERLVKRLVDNCMRSQCMGSDHCPITLFLKM